jgi:hypothetical protein
MSLFLDDSQTTGFRPFSLNLSFVFGQFFLNPHQQFLVLVISLLTFETLFDDPCKGRAVVRLLLLASLLLISQVEVEDFVINSWQRNLVLEDSDFLRQERTNLPAHSEPFHAAARQPLPPDLQFSSEGLLSQST